MFVKKLDIFWGKDIIKTNKYLQEVKSMITTIHIKNIGIIEDVTLELNKGFHVLTGETGAGKSLIIDSLEILAGGRFSKEMIRKGEEYSFVEANLYLPNHELADEGNIILTREIHLSGRNSCKINGRLVTVGELKEFMKQIMDIHGQNDNQKLLDEKEHIHFLDQYQKEKIQNIKEDYQQYYTKACQIKKELKENYGDDREKQRKLDLLKYQLKEIEEASLREGEEETLEEQRKQMIYQDKIKENLGIVYQCLSEQSIDAINTSIRALEKLEKIDEQYAEKLTSLKTIYYDIQEFSRDIEEMNDSRDWDEEDRIKVEERLDLITSLKRKYGNTISEILQYKKEVDEEILQIENLDEFIQKKKEELEQIERKMKNLATQLHQERVKIATVLEANISKELEDLEMKHAKFQIEVQMGEEFFKEGMDKVRFKIKTNVGNDFKPLVKIASGGELSRIMLALKTVFAKTDEVPVMVFDEIDTGMSGKAAKSVSEKLAAIAQNHQIFVITHLAVIAAKADHHYFIYKEVEGENTKTKVKQLKEQETIYELARMSTGEITKTAIQHVLEMKKTMLGEKVVFANS